jgi:hypothetical protein
MPGWRTLLNIVDLHDGAFRLRVLWILYHRHVQFVLIFVEGDVGRTSARAETVLAWERSLYLILSTLTKQPSSVRARLAVSSLRARLRLAMDSGVVGRLTIISERVIERFFRIAENTLWALYYIYR